MNYYIFCIKTVQLNSIQDDTPNKSFLINNHYIPLNKLGNYFRDLSNSQFGKPDRIKENHNSSMEMDIPDNFAPINNMRISN